MARKASFAWPSSLLALALSDCTSSSGVIKTGPDTYSITVSASQVRGNVGAARRMAYQQANARCALNGLEAVTLSENDSRVAYPGPGQVELNFRCAAAGK